jgi:CheY-like chemotaxis protein
LKKILIIDDDTDMVEAMKIALESVGYNVNSAPNGTLGLQELLNVKPDLVILDVMMETDTEGFNVAWAIRSDDENSKYTAFKNIPILMITAVGQEKKMKFDPKKDQDFLPVNDFVEKPVRPADLIAKVAKYLG